MPRARPFVLAALVAAILCPGGEARCASRVSFSAGEFEFAGLSVRDLGVTLEPGGTLLLRAAKVRGLAATGPLSKFALDCRRLRVTGDEIRCDAGRLSGSLGSLGAQDTRFRAARLADGRLRLGFDAFGVAGGRGRLDVEVNGARWHAEARLAGLEAAELAVLARPWFALPAGFTVAGQLSGDFHAAGVDDALRQAGADVTIASLGFSDAAGTLAGEKLAGTLRVEATADASSRMPASGKVSLTAGQAYSDPVFLDFGVHRADLGFEGALDTATSRFSARRFELDHADVLTASGEATLDFAGETLLPAARVHVEALRLAAALPAYAQPFLINTAFRDVVGAGVVRGDVEIADGLPARAALELEDVRFASETAAVSLAGLAGRLHWYDDASRTALAGRIDDALFESSLAWSSGRLWGLEIGAATIPFATTGRHFRLLGPVTVPVFDGGLAVDTLRVRHAGTEDMYVRFDATVLPIDVARISRAFGWPEFQGTLQGSIPGLQLQRGVVTLDGALEADVFDGRVAVRELRLQDPLGKYPRFFANIGIDGLDLELVTRAFEFGTITGRLSGYISDLETFDWMPEAFDAFLYTPPDDRSRHRISQRAVKNLSSIGGGSGGGVAAALQGGFLRFFDDFRYDRLGLSCRLANDVCVMGGVLPAPGGYYIVKGSGLPRINVIGSQTRVAWTTLVRQLGSVMDSEIVVQ